MEQESNLGKKSVPAVLPWVVGITAVLLYLATLNHWISSFNLSSVARINGWYWQPNLINPLFALVTYPFHLLPAKLVPMALNLFAAVCAGLTVALLARSVVLLPNDRTDAQRQRPQSASPLSSTWLGWIPPVLATAVCGLQLTFWEHATNASGEMFNLLLFAYIIRCLLEYRIDRRETWLTRSAVLYGAGMANNWALISFFPVFIAALIWMMGLKFFNLRFLVRMTLLGLAGISLYLLLPLVQNFSKVAPVPFWQGLKISLIHQKNALLYFPVSKNTILLLGLTSLLPVFVMSIRWASYFGDPSPIGVTLATLIFHVVHGLFLLACCWVAFDPIFSARYMGNGISFLTFYYLGALSVGYFSGYFLLVFDLRSKKNKQRRVPIWEKWVNTLVTVIVGLLLLLVPTGLVYKNLPEIRRTNGPAIIQYATLLTKSLPENAVIFSDDPWRLQLAEASLTRSGRHDDYIAIDTQFLKWPQYHDYLRKRYGTNWPEAIDAGRKTFYEDPELVNLTVAFSKLRPVYYLHPGFGYYFEFFYQRPHGLVHELKKYPPGMVTPPPLTEIEIAENQTFWKNTAAENFPSLLASITPPSAGTNFTFHQYFMDMLHLTPQPNRTANFLGPYYSQTLNYWGVEMQKAGQLDEAGQYFATAQELNPNNVVATINQRFNHNLRTGEKTPVELTKSIEDKFGIYQSWAQVVGLNGPFDDPNFCLAQGRVFAEGGNIRQAAIQLERVIQLAPDNVTAHIWLGLLYAQKNLPDRALDLVKRMRARPEVFLTTSTNRTDLLVVETTALFSQKEITAADKIIQTALRKNPSDAYLLNSAFQVCLNFSRYSNALVAVDGLLQITPDDSTLLANKGRMHVLLGGFNEAIPTLTRALALDTNNHTARLYRAIAYLRADKLDEARRDYEALQKVFPKQFQIDYGLGEIAYRRRETNAAIQNYEAYLADAFTNTTEAQSVLQRLKELKGEKP
jgi:tetratricopeptide (TPR) repeat protein